MTSRKTTTRLPSPPHTKLQARAAEAVGIAYWKHQDADHPGAFESCKRSPCATANKLSDLAWEEVQQWRVKNSWAGGR
jgi:hypothetical protein